MKFLIDEDISPSAARYLCQVLSGDRTEDRGNKAAYLKAVSFFIA